MLDLPKNQIDFERFGELLRHYRNASVEFAKVAFTPELKRTFLATAEMCGKLAEEVEEDRLVIEDSWALLARLRGRVGEPHS